MGCLNGEKRSAAWADHTDDIHAQMAAVSGHPGFSALFVPAFSGTRVTLKAGFIGKPDINIGPIEHEKLA